MLNIGKLAGARSAEYYLDKVAKGVEDYYLHAGEAPGQWHGRAAPGLGLAGEVVGRELMELLSGMAPGAGERLAQPQRGAGRLWGYDLTFRAPKSVSLLFALGEGRVPVEVRSAHEAGVEMALAYLEREAGFGRRRVNGEITSVPGSGLVAAAFQHRTSRAGDPLLHTHLLVANLVRGADGRWGALDGRLLYAHAKVAGALYQAQLRTELTRRLGVGWTPVRRGLAEVAGVRAPVLRAFSRRRVEIEARMASRGETSAKAAQMATLDTRQAKDYGVQPEGLIPEWRARAVALGFGPEAVVATLGVAHEPQLERGVVETAVDGLVGPQGLTERASSVTRRDVILALCDALGPTASATDIEKVAERVLGDPGVIELGDVEGRLRAEDVLRREDGAVVAASPDERRFSTAELLATERGVVEGAAARAGAGAAVVPVAALDTALTAHPTLSSEQAAMVRALVAGGAGVAVVRGHAGTGKTYALDACRQAWEASGHPVVGCALSARAAAELQAGAGITSSTLDRLLLEVEADRQVPRFRGYRWEEPRRGDGREDVLRPGTVVVVDEAGMVGTRKLGRLLEAAAAAKAKVVLVGDDRQLPEIDAGGAFRGLAARLGAVELTENRRQRDGWERKALEQLREGSSGEALAAYAAHDRVVLGDTAEEVRGRLVADWWAAGGTGGGIMVAPRMADVRDLNERARALRVGAAEVTAPELSLPGGDIGLGDCVLALRNDRQVGVVNGTRGVVSAVDQWHREVVVDVVGGGSVRLPREYLEAGHLTHGYALTAHKAQGMTAERAFVLGDDTVYREWGYTALSRGCAENRLYVVAGDREEEARQALHGERGVNPSVAERLNDLEQALRRSRQQGLAIDQVPAAEQAALRRLSDTQLLADLKRATSTYDGPRPAEPRPQEPMPGIVASAEREVARSRRHQALTQERLIAAQQRVEDASGPLARLVRRGERQEAQQALLWAQAHVREAGAELVAAERALSAIQEQREAVVRWEAEAARLRAGGVARGVAIAGELAGREHQRRQVVEASLQRLEAAPPPSYLITALGERPDGLAAQQAWREAALALERHRERHDITDPERPLGEGRSMREVVGVARQIAAAREVITPSAEPGAGDRAAAAPPVQTSAARDDLDALLVEVRRRDEEQRAAEAAQHSGDDHAEIHREWQRQQDQSRQRGPSMGR